MLITFELVADKWEACYGRGLLKVLYSEPLTPLQVLTKRDTPEWEAVPDKDRIWTVLRHEVLSLDQIVRFAQACADRAKDYLTADSPNWKAAANVDRAVRSANAASMAMKAGANVTRVKSATIDAAVAATHVAVYVASKPNERRKQIEWLVNELSK